MEVEGGNGAMYHSVAPSLSQMKMRKKKKIHDGMVINQSII